MCEYFRYGVNCIYIKGRNERKGGKEGGREQITQIDISTHTQTGTKLHSLLSFPGK